MDLHAALGRLGGKPEVYRRMLQTFVKDLAGMPEMLLSFAAQSDAGALARLLHTLKGLAATLGATALADAAARGETQLLSAPAAAPPNAPSVDIQRVAQRAAQAIGAARPGLEVLLLTLQAGSAAPHASSPEAAQAALDVPATLRRLNVLAEQLHSGDMAATQSIADLRLQPSGAGAAPLQALDDAIAALDFEGALRQCEAMIGELAQVHVS